MPKVFIIGAIVKEDVEERDSPCHCFYKLIQDQVMLHSRQLLVLCHSVDNIHSFHQSCIIYYIIIPYCAVYE